MGEEPSKEAQRAIVEALLPGELVRAWVNGQFGAAVVVTDHRALVFSRLGPIGKGSMAAWPLRSVSAISFRAPLLTVELIGDTSRPTHTNPNGVLIQRSMMSGYAEIEKGVEVLRQQLAVGQQAAAARGEQVDVGPLGDELAHASQAWTLPLLTRIYEGNDAGRHRLEAEGQILGLHGYMPASQSEDGGHIHAGRLLLTGGLSVLAGSKGTRAKGSITVTFHKTQPAPTVVSDPMEQLRKLGELRDAGVLTNAEFEAKKADMLGRL
jgi:hypothetical protein